MFRRFYQTNHWRDGWWTISTGFSAIFRFVDSNGTISFVTKFSYPQKKLRFNQNLSLYGKKTADFMYLIEKFAAPLQKHSICDESFPIQSDWFRGSFSFKFHCWEYVQHMYVYSLQWFEEIHHMLNDMHKCIIQMHSVYIFHWKRIRGTNNRATIRWRSHDTICVEFKHFHLQWTMDNWIMVQNIKSHWI